METIFFSNTRLFSSLFEIRIQHTNVPCVLTCPHALVLCVLTYLRAHVPCVLTCLRVYASCGHTCSRANVRCVLACSGKNLGKFTIYIGIEVLSILFLAYFFIFSSFNATPLTLLVKIILIQNYKSVEDD